MTNSFITQKTAVAMACALSLGLLAGSTYAQINPADAGYLTDSSGKVVRSGFGLCWRAGTNPTQAQMDECDPKPVAKVAQLETPVPKAVLPVPAGGKVTLAADTLFDFDKAVLRPAGRDALDEFLTKMKDINPEAIIAVGHADRLGSNAYNQSLSERRVEAVKTYLLGKGVAANRIQTEGKGETQPVTKLEDCTGPRNAKLIACLQPDRRVDVEVLGTRIAK